MAFIKHSYIMILTKIIHFICTLFVSIYIARFFGPEAKGTYSLLLYFIEVIGLIGILGMNVSCLYYIGKNKYDIETIYLNSILISLTNLIAVLMVFFVFRTLFFSTFLKGIYPNYIFLMIYCTPFLLVIWLSTGILLGKNRIVTFSSLRIVYSLVLVLNFMFLAVALKMKLFGAIIGYFLTVLFTALINFIVIFKMSPLSFKINIAAIREMLSYGVRSSLERVFQRLIYRTSFFLINYFTVLKLVGYYSIALSLAEMILFIPAAVDTVLFPKLTSVNRKEADHLTSRVSRSLLFLSIIIALLFFVFAKPLITLVFGLEYIPSITPLIILLPGIIMMSMYHAFSRNFSARGRPEINAFILLICLMLNIIFNLFLIPRWGINGAAWAATISYSISVVVTILIFKNFSNLSLRNILLVQVSDIKKVVIDTRSWFSKNLSSGD